MEPASGRARFLACMATESGSRRAAASNETLSGSLWRVKSVRNALISDCLLCHLLVTPYRWVINPILERALEMGERLRAAPESHLLAEVISPLATCRTLSTGDTNLQSDAVSDRKAAHLGANGHYDSGGLMTERKWLAGTKIAIREFLIIRHIRATYTG